MIIYKDFEFPMAHRLSGYKGNCSNIHGHHYKLTVGVQYDELNQLGMGIDFRELKEVVYQEVIQRLDHVLWLRSDMENKDLIALLKSKGQRLITTPFNPTAENMVIWIWNELWDVLPLFTITLCETPTSRAVINKANFEAMKGVLKTKEKQKRLKW